ncbi:MAG: hypothetical protein M1813_001561 [Trichoglossum hirsutum]|nr:MAG: hypothetical protein M1813_001561 [Trichoglossum hirsutum]
MKRYRDLGAKAIKDEVRGTARQNWKKDDSGTAIWALRPSRMRSAVPRDRIGRMIAVPRSG